MGSMLSVRRVDFQVTVELQEDVNWLIENLKPSPEYAYLRLSSQSAGTEGAGLYVGSPRSDVRLRIYNKTADLERKGVLPEPGSGELLRVELILRRGAAQRALHHRAAATENLEDLWLAHVCNRVPGLQPVLAGGRTVPPLPRLVDNRYDRATEAWIHRAVIPAIARHYAGDREALDEFVEAVVERWLKQPSRK
jgi:Replication initiation factor.